MLAWAVMVKTGAGQWTGAGLRQAQTVLLLRWVLIIATSYLVVFSHPLGQDAFHTGLFIAAYFASNVVLTELRPWFGSPYTLDVCVVVLDTVMVSVALALTGAASAGFYVVYFVIIFLSALSERLGLVVLAAILVSGLYLYSESHQVDHAVLMTPAYLLRVPFLFAVAMFFGQLVQDARSRERELEESRARERRMEFLSAVSHDLKNPLGIVQLLATSLLDGDVGPMSLAQVDLVRRIHASTRHVITMAQNLIDAARIDAGRLVLQRRSVDLAVVVEDCLLLARSAADVKGVSLRCAFPASLPSVHIDPVQMERVVSNILGNAIKFTPPTGTINLTLQLQGDRIMLAVRDEGPGMPPEVLRTVFEKYATLRRASENGSGLGLFIVRAIVEAHGGRVALASTVGHGTTVTVEVPVAPPEGPQSETSQTQQAMAWQRVGMQGDSAECAPAALDCAAD